MENTTPNNEPNYSVFIFFHRTFVVVDISFPFMAMFTRVTHFAFRATLSGPGPFHGFADPTSILL